MSTLLQWHARWNETRLHLFLSSPGDCQAEREKVREIVGRINVSAAARNRKIELKLVRWEDLPPGEAQPGNLQGRIDDLLKRYDLNHFEIYLGCMKDRVGTPSGEAKSGTLKELADATERRRKTGFPAEVLFYFVRERAARPVAVQAIADELTAKGFLYAETPSLEDFEHLTRIVTEWFAWRNRLRRAAAKSPIALAAVVVVMLLIGGGTNIAALIRVSNTLDRDGPSAAAESWSSYRPYMIFEGGIRASINDAFAVAITSQRDLGSALKAYGRWVQMPVFESNYAANIQKALAVRVKTEVEQQISSAMDLADLTLWQRAIDAGAWSVESPEASASLAHIAAKRIFEALISQGSDPTHWGETDLTTLEMDGVRKYARAVIEAHPDLITWGNRQERFAIAAVLGDAWLIETLATDALGRYDTFDQPEIALFINSALPEDVASWLGAHLSPQVPIAVLARLAEAINTRNTASITLALMDQIQAGRTVPDAAQLEVKLDCADHVCRTEALDRVRRWLSRPGASIGPMLSLVLGAADLDAEPIAERPALAAELIQRLLAGKGADPANDAMLRFLATLRVPSGRAFLDGRIAQYLDGHISFGIGERAALIDGLHASKAADRLDRARDLSRGAQADIANLSDRRPNFTATAIDVHAAYLDLLATSIGAWPQHAKYVGSLIDLRLADTSFTKTHFDAALTKLLSGLGEDAQIAVLDFPKPPLVDDRFGESKWERRSYLLGILEPAIRSFPPRLVQALATYNPSENGAREYLDLLVARRGGTLARSHFKAELAGGRLEALPLLAAAGDVQAVREFIGTLDGIASDARVRALPIVVSAIGALEGDAVHQAITDAALRFGKDGHLLWKVAQSASVSISTLEAIAEQVVGEARDRSRMPAAIGYLAAVDPDRLGKIFEDQAKAQAFADYLKMSSPWDWLMVTQELGAARLPAWLIAAASQRGMLVALDPSQVALGSRFEQGFMPFQGKLLNNPLLFVWTHNGQPRDGVIGLLQLSSAPPASIDVEGTLSDRRTAYQAYTLWLAAMVANPAHLTVPELTQRMDVVNLLRDSEPALAKASASLLVSAAPP
jgi:hypothetical protein